MKFDDKTVDLLKYAVALYLRGDIPTASLFASTCYESLLPKQKDKDENAPARLQRLVGSYPSLQPVYNNLKVCNRYRNDIIHHQKYVDIEDFLIKLQESIGLDFSKRENRIDNEEFRFLKKKVLGSVSNETSKFTDRPFVGFIESDFRDLFVLKEKMVFLREAIANFCLNELEPPLYFDDVSEVANNSAWVWLAAVTTLEKERPKIELPSISVLGTNNDIRLYIEFGGRCKKERQTYHDLLLSKQLDDDLRKLKGGYSFFDIYWYFNIENKLTIQEFVEKRDLGKIAFDKDFVKEGVKKFQKEINQKLTIQNNRHLIGKVYSRDQVVEMGPSFITETTDTFSQLLPILNKVQSKN